LDGSLPEKKRAENLQPLSQNGQSRCVTRPPDFQPAVTTTQNEPNTDTRFVYKQRECQGLILAESALEVARVSQSEAIIKELQRAGEAEGKSRRPETRQRLDRVSIFWAPGPGTQEGIGSKA
jgi:hypothetical protein